MEEFSLPGYEILEKLGQGGMGTVYKARQESLDRLVAIKTLSPLHTQDEEYVNRFQQEARAAGKLKYHGIVQVHEAGNHEGTYYFIMEYVGGYSVGEWLVTRGKLPEDHALKIAKAVSLALEYAWEEGRIIHRDVKPDNILIDDDGTIKISDLGLAKIVDASKDAAITACANLTMGTPNYCSPEQINAEETIDFRADIYSLGAVLYHMLTDIIPFAGTEGVAAMVKHVTDHIEDPQIVDPNISSGSAWLIEKNEQTDSETHTPRERLTHTE